MYDIRYNDDAGQRGKIYKYRLENRPDLPEQYFLFAYHSGMGIDSQDYPISEKPVLSQGLEVQHVVLGTADEPVVVDIESAYGLFHDIPHSEMPNNDWPPTPSGLGTQVPAPGELGFDNWDLWWKNDNSSDLRTLLDADFNWAGYTTYFGSKFDFFTTNEHPYQDGSGMWSAPEFSYKTSPSGYWYNNGNYSGKESRFNSQNVPNSMFVKVLGQHDVGLDGDGPHMFVDFLSSPFEEVQIISGENYSVGDNITIEYSYTPEWGDFFEGFNVFFCPTQTGGPLYPVGYASMSQAPGTYSFPVLEEYGASGGGQIFVEFVNSISSSTWEVSVGPVNVLASPIIKEDLLSPISGDRFFANKEMVLEWSHYFNNNVYSSIDVVYDSGNGWVCLKTLEEFGVDWFLNEETERNFCSVIVDPEMVTPDCMLKLLFWEVKDSPNESNIVSGVNIFPPLTEYEDISEVALEEVEPYLGSPYSIVPIDSNPLGGKGLVMSLPEIEGQDKGMVLDYSTRPEGNVFTQRANGLFSGESFSAGLGSIAVADYDGDGDEDFFVCSQGNEESILFTNEAGLFHGTHIGNTGQTNKAYSATWVDVNHDGYLDLYLGRWAPSSEPAPKNSMLMYFPDTDDFGEVGIDIGLYDPSGNHRTKAVCWVDLDLTGYWDVIVGDDQMMGTENQVFSQNDDGLFHIVTAQDLPFKDANITSLIACDFNADNELDVLVGQANKDETQVYLREAGVFTGEVLSISLPFSPQQMNIGDSDLDGAVDLIVTSGTEGVGFTKLMNFTKKPEYGIDFLDVGQPSGLPVLGTTLGVTQADFNLDGKLDLFSGIEDGALAGTVLENNGNTSSNLWLGVRLYSASGATPCGAIVSLSGDSRPLGSQVFNGNSGQGSQGSNDLIFGIGDSPGPYTVHVKWPSRAESTHDVSSIGFYMEIEEPTEWSIKQQSPIFEVVVGPDRVDWCFSWETVNWTPASDDWVDFTPIQNCGSLVADDLVPGATPNVSTTINYYIDKDSGQASYTHTLIYENAPCLPGCSISFTVHSGNSALTVKSSGLITGRFPKFCPVAIGN